MIHAAILFVLSGFALIGGGMFVAGLALGAGLTILGVELAERGWIGPHNGERH